MNFIKRLFTPKKMAIFSATSISAALLYPQINSQIELYHQDTLFNRFILSKCKEIRRENFFPTPYLGYGILQAFFGSKSQYRHEKIIHSKQYLDLGDYGEVVFDVAAMADETLIPPNKKDQNGKSLIVILLGVTASSTEPYVENMAAEALKEGYKVVLFNERVYNNYEQKGRIYPKQGYYDLQKDFEQLVQHIIKIYPDHKYYAIGHSFGANTLVNYLGTHQSNSPFLGAVSVGNPFDFNQVLSKIKPKYNRYFAETRKTVLQMRESLLRNPPDHIKINFEKVFQAKTIEEFDEVFSKEIAGHKSLHDLYQSTSCINQLSKVTIPLLCLNSKDDPCVHHSTIPFGIQQINKNVMLLVTQCGGHVGWFEGILNPKRWYMKPTMEFINALSEFSGIHK